MRLPRGLVGRLLKAVEGERTSGRDGAKVGVSCAQRAGEKANDFQLSMLSYIFNKQLRA